MAHIFIDPSALLKQYIREEGSESIRGLIASPTTETIFVAEIALAEVAAVIAAKRRASGGISDGMRQRILTRFLFDCKEHYILVKTDRPIIDRAVTLSQKYRLRGYDAVQLATALSVQIIFDAQLGSSLNLICVASDLDLLAAASAEGMATLNPSQ